VPGTTSISISTYYVTVLQTLTLTNYISVTQTIAGPTQTLEKTLPGPTIEKTLPGPTQTLEKTIPGPTQTLEKTLPGPTQTIEKTLQGPTSTLERTLERTATLERTLERTIDRTLDRTLTRDVTQTRDITQTLERTRTIATTEYQTINRTITQVSISISTRLSTITLPVCHIPSFAQGSCSNLIAVRASDLRMDSEMLYHIRRLFLSRSKSSKTSLVATLWPDHVRVILCFRPESYTMHRAWKRSNLLFRTGQLLNHFYAKMS
jgi:hypothetical protein